MSPRKLTQDEISLQLLEQGIKLDRTAIARIENQPRSLYDHELVAIAAVLEIPMGDVLREMEKAGDYYLATLRN